MEELIPIFNILKDVLKDWWWILPPILLIHPFLFLWLWWRRESWARKQKFLILEIKIPKEVLKPLRAMEQVFSNLWGIIYTAPEWWEKWIEGQKDATISLEIVSLDGKPHFLIRVPESGRNAVESAIYSQYPDAEISIVDDYTKYIPSSIPNKDWDLWGTDMEPVIDDIYPVKTYAEFFEPMGERIAKEEKRLDPLASLIEGMSQIGVGEQLWVQIIVNSLVGNASSGFISKGKAMIDKLAKRQEKPKQKSIIGEAVDIIVSGKREEPLTEEKIAYPEMQLTADEREVVTAISNKISKNAFACTVRFVYLAKREKFLKTHILTPFSFFSQFSTANLNAFKPRKPTSSKLVPSWFLPLNLARERRIYVRQRKIFENYIKRRHSLFPRPTGTFVLNTEEVATLYHFPGKTLVPTPSISRVEAKRSEPPPELPTE